MELKNLKTSTQKRMVIVALILGVLGFLMGLISLTKTPEAPEVGVTRTEVAEADKAERWGRDYLTLWLAGSSNLQSRLDAMVSIPDGGVQLPRAGASVTSISSLGSDKWETYPDGDSEWTFTYRVSETAVGERADVTRYYSVHFMQHGTSYQAVGTPVPKNRTETPFRLEDAYTSPVDLSSPLGKAVSAFATEYLTKGTNGSMGRAVVSESYHGAPLQGSPYQRATVDSIRSVTTVPGEASTGDTVQLRARVRAEVSGDAYNTITLPLRLVYTDQGQWVVDELEFSGPVGDTKASGGK